MNKKIIYATLLFALTTLTSSLCLAGSTSLAVQGFVTDIVNGDPLEGSYSVTFNLYATCDDSEPLQTETAQVEFANGFYSSFTDVEASLIAGHGNVCLGVQIGDDIEMSPRLEYHATPYSKLAEKADVATVALTLQDSALDSLVGSGLMLSANNEIVLDTSSAQTWSAAQTYSSQMVVSSSPVTNSSANATMRINPVTAVADGKMLVIQDNGTDRFSVDKEGDVSIGGNLTVTGSLTPASVSALGLTISSTELSFLDGVTSNIQAQLSAAGTGDITAVTAGNGLTGGALSGAATVDVGVGSGISVAADAISLGALSADWSQTGAFDIVLGNASSELKVMESVGGTFYGIIDVTDLTADRTYTLPDTTGTLALTSSNITGNSTTATALAANGANCAVGNYPLGVDASGVTETCTADDDAPDADAEVPDALTISGGTVNNSVIGGVTPAVGTFTTLRANTSAALEETGIGTDTVTMQAPADATLSYTLTFPIDDGTANQVLTTDGVGVMSWASNVATATALAANGANCGAGNYPLGVDASGVAETCTADDDTPDTDAEVPNDITVATSAQLTVSRDPTDGTSANASVRLNPATSAANEKFLVIQDNGTDRFTVDKEGDATLNGRLSHTVQSVTIADNAVGASAASGTLTPSSSYIEVTCNDADGCNITMDETGAIQGSSINVVNVSANAANFADTALVSELAGVFAVGQYDSLTLGYASDRWVERGRSNN